MAFPPRPQVTGQSLVVAMAAPAAAVAAASFMNFLRSFDILSYLAFISTQAI
jgi:hypothetical protein